MGRSRGRCRLGDRRGSPLHGFRLPRPPVEKHPDRVCVLRHRGSAVVRRPPSPAQIGSRRPSFGRIEVGTMYPILGLTTTPVNETRRDTALRTYARLEYGEPDATWLIVGARPNGETLIQRR